MAGSRPVTGTDNPVHHFPGRLAEWLGWCPNHPALRTAPVVFTVQPATVPVRGSAGSRAGTPGRIRDGFYTATASIRALFQNRSLLWFSFFTGILALAMILIMAWMVTGTGNPAAFLITLPSWTGLYLLDARIFLLLMACLAYFTIIIAALVHYRSRELTGHPCSVREAFFAVGPSTFSLMALSVLMSLAGTVIYAVVTETRFFGGIVSGITMTAFYLPYAYYFPNTLLSALFFSAILAATLIVLCLTTLYVVPLIVQEKRGLISAFAGSAALMKNTWRELLGVAIVYGAIFMGFALIAVVIGQSPVLLGHDYDFFLQVSRGMLVMMAVSYGFVLTCGIMIATGSTVLGIAVTDLYLGKTATDSQRNEILKSDVAGDLAG